MIPTHTDMCAGFCVCANGYEFGNLSSSGKFGLKIELFN